MKILSSKNWLKSDSVKAGDLITILTEGEIIPSARFTYDSGEPRRDFVIKIKHNDQECDFRINATNKKILVKAFGDETSLWINKQCKLDTAQVMVSGKMLKTIMVQPVGGVGTQYEA